MTVRAAARIPYTLTERAYRALAAPPEPMPERANVAARTRWVLTDRARALLGADRRGDNDG